MTTMSKMKDKAIDQQNEQQQPTQIDELLKNGTVVMTAASREALAEMVNDIPADCKYCVGAVGQNPVTGVFSLRVDLCEL